jgi:transcriptional regulator
VYLPPSFTFADLAEAGAFVDAAQSADLVTFDGVKPVATLLPVIWDRPAQLAEGDYGRVLGHLAIANDQWKTAQPGAQALVIVHGPQAYISRPGTRARPGTAAPCRPGITSWST